jgi:hypothetical protein
VHYAPLVMEEHRHDRQPDQDRDDDLGALHGIKELYFVCPF